MANEKLIKKIVDAKDKNNDSVEIWGTGRPIREWIYVEDSAMAILKTIENFDNFIDSQLEILINRLLR